MSAMSFVHPLSAPAKSGFCKSVAEVNTASKALSSLGDDTAKGVKAFETVASKMKSATGSAPSDIKSDWNKLSVAINKVTGLVKKLTAIKGTDAKATQNKAKLQAQLTKVMADPSTEKANTHLTAWAKKECGIDFNA